MKQFLTINDNGDMLNIDMIAAITLNMPTENYTLTVSRPTP